MKETEKHILWFESTLTENQLKQVKDEVTKLGLDFVVVHGIKAPTVVTLRHFEEEIKPAIRGMRGGRPDVR